MKLDSKKVKWPGWPSVIAIVLGLWLLSNVWQQGRTVETVPYSVFEEYLRDRRLTEVQVGDRLIIGTLGSPRNGKTTIAAEVVDPAMADRLER